MIQEFMVQLRHFSSIIHETNQFLEGPKLIRGRYRFACGLFQKNGRETIIVAGGYAHSNGYPSDSVEYMYLDELVWQEGRGID